MTTKKKPPANIIGIGTLKSLLTQAQDLQTGLFLDLEDETVNRAMKTVVKHLTKYVMLATASPTKSISVAETETHEAE